MQSLDVCSTNKANKKPYVQSSTGENAVGAVCMFQVMQE